MSGFWVAVWIVSIGCSAGCGYTKGKLGTGLMLGFLLSFVGLIIMCLLPESYKVEQRRRQGFGFPDWYPDPLKEHEMRYYDGVEWTAEVFDDGEIGRDA